MLKTALWIVAIFIVFINPLIYSKIIPAKQSADDSLVPKHRTLNILSIDPKPSSALIPEASQIESPDRNLTQEACQLTEFNGIARWVMFYWDIGDGSVQYYDPADCGASTTYPFRITSLQFSLYTSTANPSYTYMSFPVAMDVVVYDLAESGDPCDGPGNIIYRFPFSADQASFKYPNVGTATFPGKCCVNRPFFVGVEYTDTRLGRDTLPPCILADSNLAPVQCHQYFYDVSAGEIWQNWTEHGFTNNGYQYFYMNGQTECDSCKINADKVIGSIPYTDNGSTVGHTDDYDYACGGGTSKSPDVVYSYTPSIDQEIYISLCNSDYDTKLFVYRNSIMDLVACNEDYCGVDGLQSKIWWLGLEAGDTYYIVVDGWGDQAGSYELVVDYFEEIVVECPIGATLEGEPTGCDNPDITNGGCNSGPPVFGSISCGDTICGSAGTFISKGIKRRDTDWYQFTLDSYTQVNFFVQAEFPVIFGIVPTNPPGTGNCSENTGFIDPNVMSQPGERDSIQVILGAGTYWFYVAPQRINDNLVVPTPCDAGYVASMTCECALIVDFEASPRWGAGWSFAADFSNNSISNFPPATWTWDFGDGQTSNAFEPTHVYTTPGRYDVTLTATDGCRSVSKTKKRYIYLADKFELGFVIYEAEGQPVSFSTSTDIDNDNNADLIFCDWPGLGDNLTIAFGKGDGTFENPLEYLTGFGPYFDFGFLNRDTLLDIIVIDSGSIVIMSNNGDRTFTNSYMARPGAGGPGNLPNIITGYFNNDPFLDIAFEPNRVYFGDGDGAFPNYANLPAWMPPAGAADFNNDGFDDILAVGSDSAYICISDGNGHFACHNVLSHPLQSPSSEASTNNGNADFNRDGNVDFAYISDNNGDIGYVIVGYGNGLGGIIRADTIPIYGWAYGLKLADINRDHNLDIVVCNHKDITLEIYYGDSLGNFNALEVIDLPDSKYNFPSVAVADFDRDGNPDFAAGQFLGYETRTPSILTFISTLPDAPVLNDEMTITGLGGISLNIQSPDTFSISKNFTTVAGANYWRVDINNDSILDAKARDYNLQYGEYKIVITPRPNAAPASKCDAGIRIDGSVYCTAFLNYGVSTLSKAASDESDSLIFYYTVEPVSSMQPPNGQPTYSRPIFDWSKVVPLASFADSFHFQLDRYYDFQSPIIDVSGLTSATYRPINPLGLDSVFYWHFRSFKGGAWTEFSRTFAAYVSYESCCLKAGDANNDTKLNLSDVSYIINRLYRGGPDFPCRDQADANGDTKVNLSDVSYIINKLYRGGPDCKCP
jgi:PKD repeat protein